jgi:hypothetical protein
MKKNLLLTLLFGFLGWHVAHAELPNGSTAEDWTLTDLNGNSHNLYSYLDNDQPVVIDFSATWCGPCWSYHNSGVLEDLYTDFGPGGTNEIQVFFIEPDLSTNVDCLYGLPTCVGGTYGDWTLGTDYPIIELTSSTIYVKNDYNVNYYPTLYAISPDRRTWEVGQSSQNTWENWMFESFELEVTATVEDALCGDNGSIDLASSGGYNSVNFNWNNGMTGANITGLQAGTYTVMITDSYGYYIERSYDIAGPASGQELSIDVLSNQSVDCNGNATGALSVQGLNGNYGYSYDWSNGQTGPNIYDLTAGSYTVSITDAANCVEEFTLDIDEPSELTSVAVETDDACGNSSGEVLFVPLGGTSPHWFDIGNGPEPYTNFTDLAAGNYPYTQIDNNGCTYSDEFDIEVVGIPTAAAEAPTDLDCIMTEVTVSGTGSSTGNEFNYNWTTSNGNITSPPNTIDITVDQPGDYELAITNTIYGCIEYATASVDQTTSNPTAAAAQPSTLSCAITEVTLDGSGSSAGANFTYLWTTTDGTIVSGETTLTPIVSAVGTYTLTVTNTNDGCSSTSQVVVPGNYAQPTITTTNGEITCSSTDVEICATVDAGVTVVWQTPNGPVSGTCVTVSAAGTYTATATGTNGCTKTETSTVTQSSDIPQTAIATPEMITCDVTQITLEGSLTGDVSMHTIVWTTLDGNIVNGENTLTPTVDMGGSYVMEATNNNNGCSSQVTTTVTADASLPAAGFSYTASVGIIELINGSNNFDGDIIWDLGNGETAEGEVVTVMYEETGIYTICVTVTNECGEMTHCEDIQFVTIMGYEEESTSLACFGDNDGSITITPNGGLPAYAIAWTGPNGYASTDLSISDLTPGLYTMTLTDQAGNSATEQFTITEPAELLSETSTTDASCFGSSDGTAIITMTGGTAPYDLNWDVLDPDQLPAGDYSIDITDANGCLVIATATINEPAELAISSADVMNADNGQANGSITITPEGGTGNISVTWDNGLTGADINGLAAGFYTPTLVDDNGCMVVLEPIEVKSASNIEDLSFVNNFFLSPNPATNNINLKVDLNSTLDANVIIRNVVGQIKYNQSFNNTSRITSSIDVSNFEAGMYTLTLNSGNSNASQKFIVIK